MSVINAKYLFLGLCFCGAVGSAMMNNLYAKVSISQISQQKCKKYWEKTQKYKVLNFRMHYLVAKSKFYRCFTSEMNSQSKEKKYK
jgi:hypothetical protein